MKNESSIRIAVAEACKWSRIEWYEDNAGPPILHGHPPFQVGISTTGEWEAKRPEDSKHVPDYLRDLNTRPEMLEAIVDRRLSKEFEAQFADKWNALTVPQPDFCRYFLKTIGTWDLIPA